MDNEETVMPGVREYGEHKPVSLYEVDGRLCVLALNEGGFNSTSVDLLDLLLWLQKHRPSVLASLPCLT